MTTKKTGVARRRIQVAGQDRSTAAPELSFADALRLDNSEDESPGRAHSGLDLERFVLGQLTLGELERITKQHQYEIAQIGYAYLSAGKLIEAKKIYEGLLALDPYDAYFHLALGSIAQQDNDLKEAEQRYTRALEINPFAASAFANRGEVRVMSGRLAEGAEDLVKAIELDPEGLEAPTLRAIATVRVLKEQLGAVDVAEFSRRAREASDSKVQAAQQVLKPHLTPQPRAPGRGNQKPRPPKR